MISKNVAIIFVTQQVTIATPWPAKNTLNTALGDYNSKKARWNKHHKSQILAKFKKMIAFNNPSKPSAEDCFEPP